MTENIIELQVGYHANKTIPYQRIICDTDFTNPYYECNKNMEVYYSKEQPQHWDTEVYEACKNLDLILKVAKMNYENKDMVATIRDNQIITGDDIDIWKDIKVWVKGTYPKKQSSKLSYIKHSYSAKWLKKGIHKILMKTKHIYHKGHVLSFEIKSSTFQNYYHVSLSGYNRVEWEKTDAIHGRYHGYHYFDTFEELQDFFKKKYNVTLVKEGATQYHKY